jgi:hypothetical protein
MITESCHVIRTRITDPADICTTRTFRDSRQAQREADAWAHAGDYARYGASPWTAEVRPGPAPMAPCGVRVCTRLSGHRH